MVCPWNHASRTTKISSHLPVAAFFSRPDQGKNCCDWQMQVSMLPPTLPNYKRAQLQLGWEWKFGLHDHDVRFVFAEMMQINEVKKIWYNQRLEGCRTCQRRWFTTVEGRNPANQLRLLAYPMIYRVFLHPRWLFRISSINSSLEHVKGNKTCLIWWKGTKLHPGRLTWNLQITHSERKMIFQTSMIMFHVNLQGCM